MLLVAQRGDDASRRRPSWPMLRSEFLVQGVVHLMGIREMKFPVCISHCGYFFECRELRFCRYSAIKIGKRLILKYLLNRSGIVNFLIHLIPK